MSTVCFIGHRDCKISEELYLQIEKIVLDLINKGTTEFLFGSKSKFNSLCLTVVSKLKNEHKNIKRIYVRAEYPYIDEEYREYLLESYDDTYFPQKIIKARRAAYIERNFEMIDKSDILICYCNNCDKTHSGTVLALKYAKSKQKEIINLAD